MPKARLTWKWKLAIAVIALVLFLMGWLLSKSGNDWLKDKIVERMEALPTSEQRDSAWADCYLKLAWWSCNIRRDADDAMEMYKRFCGVGKDDKGHDPFDQAGGIAKLIGICSPDGKTGWGPMHPRAPEAYWDYMEIYDTMTSASEQFVQQAAFKYYRLFYTWMISHTPEHRPHPRFNVYWGKIRERLARRAVYWPPDIDVQAPLAPPAPKEE